MKASQRIRRAALPAALAAVIGVGGFAVGAAVVLDDAGHIVTNAHVAGDATEFQVQLSGDAKPRAGTQTPDTTKLAEVLAGQEPGQVVSVTVTRDGADHQVRLTLGELPGG